MGQAGEGMRLRGEETLTQDGVLSRDSRDLSLSLSLSLPLSRKKGKRKRCFRGPFHKDASELGDIFCTRNRHLEMTALLLTLARHLGFTAS